MRLAVALGALVLMAAVVAYGDYNVLDKTTWYQNGASGQRVTSLGHATVVEQNPASSFQVLKSGWLSTRLTARLAGGLPQTAGVFVQDSTSAWDVRGANGLALFVYPTFDDSVSAVTLALQVRWHYSDQVDSSSAYIEVPLRTAATSGVGTARDSLGSLTFIPLTSTGLSRYSVGAAAVANTDSLATPDEQVLVLTNVSGTNRGRMIRIRMPDGASLGSAGPYMSIRVRYLNGYNASGVAWGNGTSGFEPIMNLRADLVGWR